MAGSDLIQIVDENDQVIEVATRADAQAKGLFHRIVRILVFDENGRVLLQKRTSDQDTWPNCWDNSAAGHVDAGEGYEIAARRELSEELGIDGELEKVAIYKSESRYGDKILNRFSAVFRITLPSDTQFNPQPEEVSEIRWFTLNEVGEMIKNHPDLVTEGVKGTYKYLSAK